MADTPPPFDLARHHFSNEYECCSMFRSEVSTPYWWARDTDNEHPGGIYAYWLLLPETGSQPSRNLPLSIARHILVQSLHEIRELDPTVTQTICLPHAAAGWAREAHEFLESRRSQRFTGPETVVRSTSSTLSSAAAGPRISDTDLTLIQALHDIVYRSLHDDTRQVAKESLGFAARANLREEATGISSGGSEACTRDLRREGYAVASGSTELVRRPPI